MHRSPLCLVASAAVMCGCSSSTTTKSNSDFNIGTYELTGVRVLPNGSGSNRVFTLHFSQVSSTSIAFEITAGDVSQALPAPGVATRSGDSYTMHWNGGAQFNYTIVFRAGSCEGSDINGGGDATAWATCSIRQVS